MKRVLLHRAIKLNKERKRKKHWQKIVQGLASVVVFCTTYALILPAITMEQELLCELPPHIHGDGCYEVYPYYDLSCSFAEAPGMMVLHDHARECYDREGTLRCTLALRPVHTHDDSCLGEPELLCGLSEYQAHTHSELCTTEKVLTCTVPEGQAHIHDTACSTQEQILTCTLAEAEGHSHSDACVTVETVLVCTLEETEGHSHSDACTVTEQQQICTLEESEGHTHGDTCSDSEGNSICTLEETEGHTHSESCFETVTHSCDLEEIPAHSHTDDCYETQEIPCTLPESPSHSHDDSCYTIQLTGCSRQTDPHIHADSCYEMRPVECPLPEGTGHTHQPECYGQQALVCEKEELQPHHHDENCYDAMGTMVCTLPEILEHIHGDSCLTDTGEIIRKLICTQEEHEHEDVCYAEETGPAVLEFLCGLGEHTHSETCFDEEAQLLCNIPEHIHSAACVMTDLDLTADTETTMDWNAMFRDISLSGNWPEDLVTIAQSQLDYRESRRNCALTEQQLKGYTRYGARYDQPYEDWNSLFVRFCMDYAGIRYYPWADTVPDWLSQLSRQQLFRTPDSYVPKAGDLVFFIRDASLLSEETDPQTRLQLADHVGIITGYLPETEETPAMLRTIEGDVKDRVCHVSYELQDARILGFGEMLPGFAEEMHHTGADYTVSVSLSPESQIPLNAILAVREILPEEEAYESYYRQSVNSLLDRTNAESEESLDISFARFFDIGFTVDGNLIEPAAPVSVQIRYAQPLLVSRDQSGTAVHFANSGIELLEAALSGTATLAEEIPEETSAIEETSVTEETSVPAETEAKESDETTASEPAETLEPTEEIQEAPAVQVDTFTFTQNSFSVVGTVLANARVVPATVWLDGTCGNMMAYHGSPNRRQTLEGGRLPTTWTSPSKYAYKLKGWYDVTHSRYYQPGELADVSNNTVFYADWEAATYDIGRSNNNTVASLDTSEFITTHVFDYNVLFNALSLDLRSDSTANNNSHDENWQLVQGGKADYSGSETLNFIFRDWDAVDQMSRPSNENSRNTSQDYITAGLLASVLNQSGNDLTQLLFGPDTQVIGKNYLGTGNYLYQYMDDPSDPHYGYYYYDSWRNAASYNQSENRFYVYNYREYTSDSVRDGEHNSGMGDFLPMNSPYVNTSGKNVVQISGGYQYDAKRDSEGSSTNNHAANFNFGMSSNIHFYLPHAAGAMDANKNYLNKSTTGSPLVFEFSGDDDVWVLLDGKLLLDIGGIHGVQSGRIDFSAGLVYVDNQENPIPFQTPEGSHDLTIYYMERGSSKSNCSIYFNLAPRYGLDLEKSDYITGNKLPGVVFEVFNDEACTVPATLWPSHDIAKEDSNNNPFQKTTNTFTTDEDGQTHMWGFVAGKTYYIREVSVPDGYPLVDALIRVTLNNHGTDVSEITVIRGEENTAGFEVTSHFMDKTNHLISLNLTNKRIVDPLTTFRVEKYWGSGTSVELPIPVRLWANSQIYGEPVILSPDNAWGHTWMNLPVYDASGNPIRYRAEEFDVPGAYEVDIQDALTLESDRVDWIRIGALEHNATFLLALDSTRVLTADNGNFGTTALDNAQDYTSARWTATAYSDGFRLKSGNGYYLAFHNDNHNFYLTQGNDGNQTFYYDGSQLFVVSGNVRYYVAGVKNSNLSHSTAGDATDLYKQVITKQGTSLIHITNTPIPEDRQRPLIVEKKWEGNYPQLPESILIHVKKDGDIQATLELSEKNGWKGTFEKLDSSLLDSGGYTLEEELPFGFTPEFSQIERHTIDRWSWVTPSTLVPGEIYSFVSNNRALADDNGVPKATYFSGTPTLNQSWMYVEMPRQGQSTIYVLRNMATNRYLRELGESQYVHHFTLVSQADGNCHMRLYNQYLQFYPQSDGGGWNITLNNDGTLSTNPGWGSGSGTSFRIQQNDYREEYHVTVTNTFATYVLPETGGAGTTPFHAFGTLLTAAALMYLIQPKRRRQKGGR